MKRLSFLVIVTLLLTLILVAAPADDAYSQVGAQRARITLSPNEGFSAITVSGTGFYGGRITIYWEDTAIPTVPSPLYGYDTAEGGFTAIISVPTQTEPGEYEITARDQEGATASATFTVIDMTGPQGPPGPPGSLVRGLRDLLAHRAQPVSRDRRDPLVSPGHPVSQALVLA